MAEYEAKDIRNVIVLGHSSSGKTTMVEHLLSHTGAIAKPGNVDEGNTVCDYNPDEISRKISINSSLVNFVTDGVKVNMIDTPGYADFIGEVIGSLRAVDSAIVVL